MTNTVNSAVEETTDEFLQKLITVDTPNERACILMICNVSRVFAQDVTNDLIDGIIAFFFQSIVDRYEDLSHIHFVIAADFEFDCIIEHVYSPLIPWIQHI